MNSTLTIHQRGTGRIRFVAPLCAGSIFKYTLGKEDFIRVKFQSSTEIAFAYGDFVNIENLDVVGGIASGYYLITEPTNPTYDEASGGYQYDLRLDAWYMELNKHKFMLPYMATDGTFYRREITWSLTDTFENHLRVWLINAKAIFGGILGEIIADSLNAIVNVSNKKYFTIKKSTGGDYTITTHTPGGSEAPNNYFYNDAKFVQYDGMNMIDALNYMCQTWGCEYWFASNYTLRVGRCEGSNTPYNIRNGVDAYIKASGSQGKVATRLYAYGSNKNLLSSYRKKLVFTVGSNRSTQNEITDFMRPLKLSMFRHLSSQAPAEYPCVSGGVQDIKQVATPTSWSAYSIYNVQDVSTSDVTRINVALQNSNSRKTVQLGKYNVRGTDTGLIRISGSRKVAYSGIVRLLGIESIPQNFTGVDSITADVVLCVTVQSEDGASMIQKELVRKNFTFAQEGAPKMYNSQTLGKVGLFFYSQNIYIETNLKDIDVYQIGIKLDKVKVNATVEGQKVSAEISHDWYPHEAKVEISNPAQLATFKVIMNGGSYDAVMNPNYLPLENPDSNRIYFVNNVGVADGQTYTIDESDLYKSRVNGEYFMDEDVSMTKNAVADVRLMLPNGTKYVDAVDDTGRPVIINQCDIIEDKIIFDDIFPNRVDSISEIKKHQYAKTKTDDVTGNMYIENFDAYQFVAEKASNDFSKDYIVKNGEGLFVTFNTGALAGMTFEVAWNPSHEFEAYEAEILKDGSRNPRAKWFEILVNTNYGRLLPDDTLKPSVNDEFVMYGYDASYVGDNLITTAENDLLIRAKAHLQKQLHSDRTYTLALLPRFARTKIPSLGEKVRLNTPNYFIPNRIERVLGYEICLDIPLDNPKIVVGEMAVYSRLKSIEDKLRGN